MGGSGMEVVYIDSVFVLNGLLDYLLLLCTARLTGVPLRRLRYVLGAMLGGLYAAAGFFPGWGFLSGAPVKAAVGILMALAAFGCEPHWFRLTCLFFGLSCGLAGCVLAVGLLGGRYLATTGGVLFTNPQVWELLLVTTLVYGFFSLVFRSAGRHRVRQELLTVTITAAGRKLELTALADSGCAVADPVSGRPVLVVEARRLVDLVPETLQPFLTERYLRRPAEWLVLFSEAAPRMKWFLVPYRAVGTESGLLLAFRAEWVRIGRDTYERLPVALAPGELGAGYQALWGGMRGKEGIQNGSIGKHPEAAGQVGDPFPTNHPLYWRQRHTSTAPDPGAGGGAAGPAGGGAGPAGADRAQPAAGGVYRPPV